MNLSSASALTNQFYAWERNGRGWHKADYTVDLEPPFYPFFGHYISQNIIDDGKQPTILSTLAELFKTPQAIPDKIIPDIAPIQAYPYADDEELRMYVMHVPKHFKQSTERIDQLLIMLSYRKSPIAFEIIATNETIALQWVCRASDATFLQTQLNAYFPECAVVPAVEDSILELMEAQLPTYTVDFGLHEEFMRPLAIYPHLDHEPLTALFGILTQLQPDEHIIVQILFSGTHNAWAESVMTAVCDESGKLSFFADAPEMPQLAKEKTARPLYGVAIRAMTCAPTLEDARDLLLHTAITLVHVSTSASNSLLPLSTPEYTIEERIIDVLLRQSKRVGMLLNSKELATFVHIPVMQHKKLQHFNRMTKAVSPHCVGHEYVLGTNEHQGVETKVSLAKEQRLRHIHIIGATGTGKSTLMHSLIMNDIALGNGICVLDPHGDLIDAILENIPTERINDVVLIDPSDGEYPIGFNILAAHSDLEKELLASDLVALFKRFSTSWGDQMNSVFANAIMAFVYNGKQYHVGDMRRFLIEQSYRNLILQSVTDSDIVYYWQKEFPILKSTSIGPILTRLDAFLRPKTIRNMVCQTRSPNFQELMDTSKIVLVKLSQGLMGMENSYLLGALILSKLQQTAMARQAQSTIDRIPFFCYIDEFHQFVTPSMASILSGARKYGLGLILAHQDMQQVAKYDADIANSLLSNAGTRICFRIGDADAKRLQDGFSAFSAEDLQSLNTGEAIARVNAADADFTLTVIPYAGTKKPENRERIITHSRITYGVPLQQTPSPQTATTILLPTPEKTVAVPSPVSIETTGGHAGQEQLREHRYLQMFIKKMAEEHGYRATLEVRTSDGSGLVDVVLHKDDIRIAVEICVTTTPEWELHNIEKCLAADFSQIVVCSTNKGKLAQIQKLISGNVSKEEQGKIVLVGANEFQSILVTQQPQQENGTIIKGYRVKVQYESDGVDKQALLQNIIQASRKP